MGSPKKNILFIIVVVICLLAFGAGSYLAYVESGKIGKARQQIETAKANLDKMRFADPAPSDENVKLSQKNVLELSEQLRAIREDLQRGSRLSTSSDGIGVMTGIQRYISEFQRKAASRIDDNGEPDPIELPKDFAFGFEQYLNETKMIDDKKIVPIMDKQRQILSYLLNKLMAADPHSIKSVRREVLESKSTEDSRSNTRFAVSPAISARVSGAIDTLGFSITFDGYTDSLRHFLNDLSKFDLPIVVRSVEVKRPTGQGTTRTPTGGGNNLDAIFGVFGGGDAAKEEIKEEQKPVIEENISTFTVVLEFIEIVLPAESAEENI